MAVENYPLVSVCCITFNHAPFIRQCLEGFMMQKTSFPFEVLIHDDASTDGTADIIREYERKYPDIIKPIYQSENQYSKGIKISFVYNFPRAAGKYIAMCEGDDYWIDSLKLQKQIDFLESNEEYSLCFHDAIFKGSTEHFYEIEDRDYTGIEKLKDWKVPTASMVFRKSVLKSKEFQEFVSFKTPFVYGDIPLFLSAGKCGKIRGFSDVMSVYNKHVGGITQSFRNSTYELFITNINVARIFGDEYISVIKKTNAHYAVVALSFLYHGEFKKFFKLFFRVFWFTPFYSIKEITLWVPRILRNKRKNRITR